MFTHTLTSATEELPKRDNRNSYSLPLTITLNSSDSNRKIEVSTNGGIEYIEPAVDVTTATMLIVFVGLQISNIRVTGAIGDTVNILENR